MVIIYSSIQNFIAQIIVNRFFVSPLSILKTIKINMRRLFKKELCKILKQYPIMEN